jgi:sulfur carrier protein
MKITLNGEDREVADALKLEALLEAGGFAEKRIAVEINRQIIPRSTFAEHELKPDDRIEIVHAIGGG